MHLYFITLPINIFAGERVVSILNGPMKTQAARGPGHRAAIGMVPVVVVEELAVVGEGEV